MSAPSRPALATRTAGVRIARIAADVVEVAARRGRAAELESLAARDGLALPALGTSSAQPAALALAVRPGRWLVLAEPGAPGAGAARLTARLSAAATVVDLGSALVAFRLEGPAHRALLARGCRLDLDAAVFRAGAVAATPIAQVPVTLAALGAGMLLLTPSTTARHFAEWLAASAAPFGIDGPAPLPFNRLLGDPGA